MYISYCTNNILLIRLIGLSATFFEKSLFTIMKISDIFVKDKMNANTVLF